MKCYPVKRSLLLLLILALALVACRRDDEPEEPTPTPVPATATPEEAEEPTPTAPEPTPLPVTADEEPTALDPTLIDWAPQLVYSSPAPGEKSLLNGAITIRFDQPMDTDSVEDAFAIAAADGSVPAGSFQWPRSDTLIFVPASDLKRAENYKVTVAGSAMGLNGETLADPVALELQTVGFLEVAQVLPGPGTEDVQTDGAITVLFNRPVVPLVTTAQQDELPDPLTISPAVPGDGRWISTSIYRFEPAEGFAGATTYEVTIAAGLEDVVGGLLEEAFDWQFTTFAPTVVQIIPFQQATDVVPTEPITVTFNMPMDRSSTEAAFNLAIVSGAGESVPAFSFDWSENDTVLTATPARRLSLATTYDIEIASTARSVNGAANLEGFSFSRFTTVPFPAVMRVRPAANELVQVWANGVDVTFASPMDFSTLEDQVIIEPAPADTTYSFGLDNLFVRFDLEPRTEYVVTIPGDAADPYGNTIGEPYTWRFTTDGLPPLVSLNLPTDRLAQFSSSFPTDVQIAYRNVSRINVSLYELDSPFPLLLSPAQFDNGFPLEPASRTWPIETPATDTAAVYDLQLADGAALPNGIYYLTATSPSLDRDSQYWQIQQTFLVVADINLVVKETFDTVHVWATDLASGLPVAGRSIEIFAEEGGLLGTGVTDQDGLATIPYEPTDDYLSGVVAVTGSAGAPNFGVAASNWSARTEGWSFGLANDWGEQPEQETYIFTDRPIYRPGDTLFFQGYVRQSDYGRYLLPPAGDAELTLQPNFFVDEPTEPVQIPVTIDELGGFSGEFAIPEGYPLGTYGLQFTGGSYNAYRQITIAEYRAPEFLVTVTPASAEALRGDEVEVTIETSYFFGGPATDLTVQWSVTANNYILPFEGRYYSFSKQESYFYDPFNFNGFGGRWLLGGEGVTDGNGQLTITLPADLLAELPEGSHAITVEAIVADISEFLVVARNDVTFHAAEQYVGIVPAESLVLAGQTASVDLLTTDWATESAGNIPVEVIFFKREWERIRNNDFGQYLTQWEPVDTEVDRVAVTTDSRGEAVASFVPPEGGSYYIVATLTDRGGRQQSSSTYLWALDSSFAGWRTDPAEKRMDLIADKREYNAGETATILVQSPFDEPTAAWVTIERGPVIEQYVTTINGGSDSLTIPVEVAYAPNVFVTVVVIQPEGGNDTPYADIRLGLIELIVNPEPLSLNIDITAEGSLYQPRDEATFAIEVTDFQGQPVSAELTVALVDLAVLTLKADNAPPILDAFYYRQPLRSRTGSGLFLSGEGLELEIPDQVLGMGGGGGGDALAESALAIRAEDDEAGDDDVRADFRDTAYWETQIRTDAAGRATITIPLPDNLTTWRLSAKAITAETLVGQDSADIVVSKPVLLRPVTPRFFTFGDRVFIGTIVNNNTDAVVEAEVTLEADGVTLVDAATQTVDVAARRGQLVRWEVTVDNVEYVDLTFRVEAEAYSDATKPTFGVGPDQLIPVYRFNAEDIVGTAGVLEALGRRVEAALLPANLDPSLGDISVTLSPSLAAALIEALEYTRNYDYDPQCAGGLGDRLLSTVAIARAFNLLEIDRPETMATLNQLIPQDIGRLAGLQKANGGWGWCYTPESHPWLTAYILLGLSKADEAGFDIPGGVIGDGTDYLSRQLKDVDSLNTSWEVNRQAFFLYVLALNKAAVQTEAVEIVTAKRGLLDPYAKALLLMTDLDQDTAATLLSDLGDDVVLSATGAHWEDQSRDFRNLSSDVRGTAMAINALALRQPDSLLGPNAVRWLMAARTAGHWSTTHETAWTIFALTDWMVATGEAEANYSYTLAVNGQVTNEGSFDERNLADNVDLVLPLEQLVPAALNYFDFQITSGEGRLYYTLHLDAFVDANSVQAVDRGFTVQRVYYDAACDPEMESCDPITSIEVGQQVRVELTITTETDHTFVMVEDPLPAGAEGLDPNLDISSAGFGAGIENQSYRYGYWGWWFFNNIQFRDDRVVFLSNYLPAGTYQYTYFLQATIPGEFQVRPTLAREVYFPEVFGRADGLVFAIDE